MCGIAGFVERERSGGRDIADRQAIVGAMCDAIRHRGPDDEGAFVGRGVALGMRRLSIIDLATGHQPIANEDGTIQVVFNGEIYNYATLRGELESRGHRFRSNSDTEVILRGYREWGTDVFSRLRGMFVLALWDGRNGELVLARDVLTAHGSPGQSEPVVYYLALGVKPEELAASSSQVFLGMQIRCAQCHDHPFTAWKQGDFWGLAAFFARLSQRTSS